MYEAFSGRECPKPKCDGVPSRGNVTEDLWGPDDCFQNSRTAKNDK